MRRSFPVLVAVLGAAVLLSACGSGPGAPAAAKVDTTTISRTDLDDQLAVLADNTKWLDAVASQFGVKTLTAPNGNVSTKLSAAWLTSLINQAIVDQAYENRDLHVTDANRKAARTAANSLFSTDKGPTFGTMPKWFQDQFLEGQGRYEAVKGVVPDNPPATDAQITEMFDRVKSQYCPAGDAVEHILKNTEAEAQQVEAALAQGQSWDTLAQDSEDTSSNSAGGFLTCTGSSNLSQLPEAFRQVVSQTPVGGVSVPVQTQFGWHVIRIVPYDIANVRTAIADVYRKSLSPPMTQFINNKLLKSKLWVDPRYGTLFRGPVRVDPPKAPKPKSKPPVSTTPTS